MPGNWRTSSFAEEFMPNEQLNHSIKDLTEVEKIRVAQEQARTTFGAASFAGFSPYGNMPAEQAVMSQSSWWNEKHPVASSQTASFFASAGMAGHSLPNPVSTTMQAGAQLLAGNPIGALGSIASLGLGALMRPLDAAANVMNERSVSNPFETDQYAQDAKKREGRAAMAYEEMRNVGPEQAGWEGKMMYNALGMAARAERRQATEYDMVKEGTASRLERFFAPFAVGGVSPGQDEMMKVVDLLQKQSEASFHIMADAQAVAARINSSTPGMEVHRNKR